VRVCSEGQDVATGAAGFNTPLHVARSGAASGSFWHTALIFVSASVMGFGQAPGILGSRQISLKGPKLLDDRGSLFITADEIARSVFDRSNDLRFKGNDKRGRIFGHLCIGQFAGLDANEMEQSNLAGLLAPDDFLFESLKGLRGEERLQSCQIALGESFQDMFMRQLRVGYESISVEKWFLGSDPQQGIGHCRVFSRIALPHWLCGNRFQHQISRAGFGLDGLRRRLWFKAIALAEDLPKLETGNGGDGKHQEVERI